jgi:hypothetical protein
VSVALTNCVSETCILFGAGVVLRDGRVADRRKVGVRHCFFRSQTFLKWRSQLQPIPYDMSYIAVATHIMVILQQLVQEVDSVIIHKPLII